MLAEDDSARERRKRSGKYLGVAGLLLLFGSAISVILAPSELYLLIPLLLGIGLLIFGYFLVR